MKKLAFLFLFFIVITGNLSAQNAQWAKVFGHEQIGQKSNRMNIETDKHSLIFAGLFVNTIKFGNQTFTSTYLSSNDPHNGFLVKTDHSGNVQWAKHLIGDYVGHVVAKLDGNENIVVTGTYTFNLSIDNKTITTPEYGAAFLAKFTPAGNLLWLRNLTNFPKEIFNPDMAIDKSGNILLTGGYRNTAFLHKLDPKGKTIFTTNVVTDVYTPSSPLPPRLYSISVAISPIGEIFVAPHYQLSTGQILRKASKYSPTGTQIWLKNIVHPQNTMIDERFNITADEHGNAYICGAFNSSVTFGTHNLSYINQINYIGRCFIAKINGTGNWIWAKEIPGGYNPFNYTIKIQPNNRLSIAGTFEGQIRLSSVWLGMTGSLSDRNTFVAHFDTAGVSVNAFLLDVPLNSYTQNLHDISVDPKGHVYLSGRFGATMNFRNIPLNSIGPNPSLSFFLGKILDNGNALSGTMFLDLNKNGLKDSTEIPYENGIIEIPNSQLYLSTTPKGIYNAYFPSGTFLIKGIKAAPHYTFNPQNHSVTFTGSGQTQIKDFALQPIPNRDDVKISVTNITPTRPGFIMKYRITYENVGTTTISDSINLNYDNQYLTYISASVTPLLHNLGKLAWVYQPLAPLEKRHIDVQFTVASTTPLNTQLMAHAIANPVTDYINWNNQDTLHHLVTGSFDPNDKQVSRSWLTPQLVADSTLLNYVIRFQNTGNDTAFTVIVRDSISDKLHMPSFELLSASHPYTFRLLENGMAEWRFDNILLPDSNRNEPASHGFIRYRMQPKNNLVLGDEIKSRAAIYFDYNAPVLTNYAVTRISLTNGIKERSTNIEGFKLYPNPAKNYVMIYAAFKNNASATVSLENLLGQTLSKLNLPANNQVYYQLPLNELPKGMYLVKLQTETGMQTQRLVIQ
ncbi:T9SS type A sorting domain-containing protein [Adhaeribacter sp. BT258]|uniref:T9SS type A sorting domain-containing protein n=1 Tax=Adhaeribacter terrigena TaxID=2793070 RepID=A0ABS1C1V3_9BACT|nr:T9SS type A sorting domain-containing protein [Adhaeribacter terrigena]MBK0403378.1 T9SS type A sorting domain-containing protein [Adhaeribacter terrigena]